VRALFLQPTPVTVKSPRVFARYSIWHAFRFVEFCQWVVVGTLLPVCTARAPIRTAEGGFMESLASQVA